MGWLARRCAIQITKNEKLLEDSPEILHSEIGNRLLHFTYHLNTVLKEALSNVPSLEELPPATVGEIFRSRRAELQAKRQTQESDILVSGVHVSKA